MEKAETMSSYDKLREKNLQEKQEMMRKLGMNILSPETSKSEPKSHVPAKCGRPLKKPPPCGRESSDEDYQVDEDEVDVGQDDEEWKNGPAKKRRKREKKAPTETTKLRSISSTAVKTTERRKTGRYPKRDNFRPRYEDDYTPGVDDILYCADCKIEWEGDCPEHGPLLVVEDTKIPFNINDKCRAKKTAPSIISVADSKIPEAGSGVWARDFIPARVRFGPYDGKRVSHDVRNPYTWLIRKNGKPHFCVDAAEPGLSNWMRFVNCARYDGEQNLEAFQYCGNIYYRTIRRIAPHEELLVWYGDDYGRQLGIDPEICDAENEDKWKEMRFKCPGCEFSYVSPLYLERHKKVCRQLKTIEKRGQTYQCHGCKFLYSDAEYLKRHVRFCRKLQQSAHSFTGSCCTKSVREGSGTQMKESLDSDTSKHGAEEYAGLKERHKQRIDSKTEKTPNSSLSVNRMSDRSQISDRTNESHPKKIKSSTSNLEVVAVIQPESLAEDEQSSPEIAPRISSDIESVLSDKIPSISPSEMPQVSGNSTAVQKLELKKIEEAYVRLERIPWFSDARAAEKPYLCTDCNERFSRKEDLDSHLPQHRLNTLFVCPATKCDKTFCAEDRVWQHVGVHFDGETVLRTDVPSKEPSESTNGHVPTGLKFFVCRKCYKFFRERENFWNHSCTQEDIESDSEKALCECSDVENPSEETGYSCDECKESFKSLMHLTLHQVTHRAGGRFADKLQSDVPVLWSEGQDLQSCLVNGERALFSERLAQFSLTYALTTKVSVRVGQELFSSESSLPLRPSSLTKRSDAEGNSPPIALKKKSERINTQLVISASLKNYLNSPKGGFVCSKCNSKFSLKSSLIVHLRSHRVTKPFICKVCKEGFLHSESFQSHISAHESEL